MALYIRDASQAQTWGRGPRVCVARARIRDRSPPIDLFARVQGHGWHVARTGMLVDARVPKVAPPIESISWVYVRVREPRARGRVVSECVRACVRGEPPDVVEVFTTRGEVVSPLVAYVGSP